MADELTKTVYCLVCCKEYPAGTTGVCPDDNGLLEADPIVGTVFADKYDILSILGEGGMSRVYKARHKFMNRYVAVKLLHESTTDSVARARFQQEAESTSALSHPNVVTVHDFGFNANGQAYFIMDCLEGKSLAHVLEDTGSLKIDEALDIFTQACEGLDHAHQHGIIHRDVKPSNLIIIRRDNGSDLVKLVDFGIAKTIAPTGEEKARLLKLTQTGEVFGTPAYMSPEQCNGRTLDARSDVYSFGCLMYEALAGEPPFLAETFVGTVVKHVNEIPKPISEKSRVKVPTHLEDVIMKCLEKEPDKRFNSAAELKQALLDAAYVSGFKGLRVGAVPEPRLPGTSGSNQSMKISVSSGKRRAMSKEQLAKITGGVLVILLGFSWAFFFYPGPEGDHGTLYSKFRFQNQIKTAEDLMSAEKYSTAAAVLEALQKETKQFGDDNRRLESVLTDLVEVYSNTHQVDKLEVANKGLIEIADQRVYGEYEELMKRLKSWEVPSQSSVAWEQRAQQANAFGERISKCADKLSTRSRQKQETLLKDAIRAYMILNRSQGTYRSMFRVQLAESYRAQQRFDEERAVLNDEAKSESRMADSPMAWRQKIKAAMLLGELNWTAGELDKARAELDNALNMTRKHFSSDQELLRSCISAYTNVLRAYHQKEYDEQARLLMEEAKMIGNQIDAGFDRP